MNAQKGYILPLVLFGSVAVLSGIGLLIYMFFYRPSAHPVSVTPLPTPNYSPTPQPITDFASCVKAGNPILESYPRKCSVNGGSFTEIIVSPEPAVSSSSSTQVLWKDYQDNDISLVYPDGFKVYTKNSDLSINEDTKFSRSELKKYLSFFADQSDHGFTIEVLSNPKNLSVPEWWSDQFLENGKNSSHGLEFSKDQFQADTFSKVGGYDVYPLKSTGQGSFSLFKFRSYVVLFSGTMTLENTNKVISSLK